MDDASADWALARGMTLVSPCRSALRIGAKGPAAIDNGDPPSLGLDHQTFEYAIARKGDDVSRIEGEHPLVTLEAGPGAQPHVERERDLRSEEHTSELQSLMRHSYAVFCLKKKQTITIIDT